MRHPSALEVICPAREATLVSRGSLAETYGSRLKGLLGRRWLASGDGLLLEPCNSIHMFFMRFAIDAVYLDADDRVLRVVDDLRPWKIGPTLRRARKVLEVPAGAAVACGLQTGDQLLIRRVDTV
jgi:hypothetical protein